MEKEIISLCGDKKVWVKFVNKVRIERKNVWGVLEPMIQDYMKKNVRLKNKISGVID